MRLAEANAGEAGWYAHLQAAIVAAPEGAPRVAAALATAQALLREQRPEEALRMIDGAAAELGEGNERIRALLEAMAVASGTLDARLTPSVVGRFEALRRLADGDPAAPREILAVAAWAAAYGNEPAEVSGVRAPGHPGEPAAHARSGRPASPWFSLVTIVLVWAERYAEAATLLETAIVECRAAGAGGTSPPRSPTTRGSPCVVGTLRTAEVDARDGRRGGRPPDAPALPAHHHRHPHRHARGARRAGGGRPGARPGGRLGRDTAMAAPLRRSRARLRMSQGLTAEALADLLAVGDVACARPSSRRASCRGARRPPRPI